MTSHAPPLRLFSSTIRYGREELGLQFWTTSAMLALWLALDSSVFALFFWFGFSAMMEDCVEQRLREQEYYGATGR